MPRVYAPPIADAWICRERIGMVKEELERLLKCEDLKSAPILVLANKQVRINSLHTMQTVRPCPVQRANGSSQASDAGILVAVHTAPGKACRIILPPRLHVVRECRGGLSAVESMP